MVILAVIRCFADHGEVQEPLVQLFRHLLGVAAGDVVAQIRIQFLKPADLPGEIADLIRFRQSEIDVPAGDIIQRQKFLLDLIRHAHQVFGPVAEQHPFFCELYAEAVPGKQLLSQLFLQGS